MNKAEAIKVLFEVSDGCKSLFDCVSIQQPSSQIKETPGGFQIRIKASMDGNSRKRIQLILNKHKLDMREEKGFVILSKVVSE